RFRLNERRGFAMQRLMIALVAVTVLGADDPKDALRELVPKEQLIPDPSVKIVSGTNLTIQVDGVPAISDPVVFMQYVKAFKAGDRAGVAALEKSKGFVNIPKGTSVLVLDNHRPDKRAGGARIFSNEEELARAVQVGNMLKSTPDKNDF